MRILFLLIFLFSFLKAESIEDFYALYKSGNYKESCNLGGKIFFQDNNRFDESFVQGFGFACLRVDNIGMISNVPRYLKKTEESRRNASYFSVIIAQKKLLYQAVIDGFDISGLIFPDTGHIISKVFSKLTKKEYSKEGNKFIFSFDDGLVVKMEKYFSDGSYKIIINEYKDQKIINKHLYW